MFSFFDNLSIRVKLVAAFLVVAVFSGVLGTVAIINVTTMKKADDFMRGFKFEVQQPVVAWCNTSPPRRTPHAVT